MDKNGLSVIKNILEGNGFRISDARPSIETVYKIRHAVAKAPGNLSEAHPMTLKLLKKRIENGGENVEEITWENLDTGGGAEDNSGIATHNLTWGNWTGDARKTY